MQTQFIPLCFEIRCNTVVSPPILNVVSTISVHPQSSPKEFDSKLQKRQNGFMRMTEHGVFVAPMVLTPATIPPPEPPDGVVELVSPRNIGRPAIKDSSQKTTPGEFSSCAAAIVSLLRSGKIVHKVTTCGHSAGISLVLFYPFSSAINDPVITTTRLAISHYPNVYSHSKLLTAIQVFDQMPKCLVGGRNSLITGCTNSGPDGVAFGLIKDMQGMEISLEAAPSDNIILDTVCSKLPKGWPENFVLDCKLQEIVINVEEQLPELWDFASAPQNVTLSLRKALFFHWNIDIEATSKIQKKIALFIWYKGCEANHPTIGSQLGGSFVPRNNIKKFAFLFLILLRKSILGTLVEELLPKTMERRERYYILAQILSAQKMFAAADMVIVAAPDQSGKWDKEELLRTRAKLQTAQGRLKNVVETHTFSHVVLEAGKQNVIVVKGMLNYWNSNILFLHFENPWKVVNEIINSP